MGGMLLSLFGGTFKDWVANRSKIAQVKAEFTAG